MRRLPVRNRPLTVTATRTEKRADEVTATVTVVTRDQIEDELATDIKDLARYEAGVSVRNSPARFTAAGSSTGPAGNSGFNIRGIEGNRVLILVDGVRVPEAYSFGAQAMGRGGFVDLETIKSVEILRGPASALYGSDGVAGAVGHDLVYGADYSTTRQEGIRGGTVPPVGETFPTRAFPTTDSTLAGVFLQDEISLLAGRLKAIPALRYDYYELDPKSGDPLFTGTAPGSQSKSRLSPKLGLVWQATDAAGLFFNYAAGFKAPAPNQVNNGFANLVSNYRSISNPDLKPETSRTFEGGVRLRGERWAVSGTAFTGKYKNFINQVLVAGNFTAANPGLCQFVNLSEVRIHGLEGRAQADLGHGFGLNVAAAYAKGTQETRGVKTPLDTVDPVKVVAGLSWRDGDGRFGGQLIATHSEGKRKGRAGGTCGATCFTPSAFTVFDATANLTDQLTVRAGVFNITDSTGGGATFAA